MIKQPTIPPMPKQPTFDARDTQYNLPIGTDTISRKQAIEVVQKRHMMLSKEKVLLINDLEQLPSTQPEIIKCMECKYYEASIACNPWGVCCHKDWIANNIGHNVDEDGWCYRAERRTTE